MSDFIPDYTGQLGDKQLVLVTTGAVLAGTIATANTTTTHQIPKPPQACYIVSASCSMTTLPVDADGTLTFGLIKREGAGDTDVAVTAVIDGESGFTASEATNFTMSGTRAQRTFAAIDILEIDLVSNSAAIDTQPVGVVVNVMWALES